ncbi:hypothetical protein GNI_082400 [Gregarina niphandrodes]|uniref:Transmembrane protein n=1 Tax=Gregarina niphandrodes TaxID=110365 RepID=A0A023B674_GRENI|nr:hypothetical protein GNI_082400 [Gregarina niphandrodes]EZG65668.1 hypothetical protein GNI_082400 [Gregarina niphandrodes]|eukprot:XP_011134061.1 hypothetical protein GNI_082400 [Gregarina niphandrodes]
MYTVSLWTAALAATTTPFWTYSTVYGPDGACQCVPSSKQTGDAVFATKQTCLEHYSQLPNEFCTYKGQGIKLHLQDDVISFFGRRTCKSLYKSLAASPQRYEEFLNDGCAVKGSMTFEKGLRDYVLKGLLDPAYLVSIERRTDGDLAPPECNTKTTKCPETTGFRTTGETTSEELGLTTGSADSTTEAAQLTMEDTGSNTTVPGDDEASTDIGGNKEENVQLDPGSTTVSSAAIGAVALTGVGIMLLKSGVIAATPEADGFAYIQPRQHDVFQREAVAEVSLDMFA